MVVLDAGRVINPHTAAEQCEGSVCWELSHAWTGGLELDQGRFVNTNFDTYNLLRIHQHPQAIRNGHVRRRPWPSPLPRRHVLLMTSGATIRSR